MALAGQQELKRRLAVGDPSTLQIFPEYHYCTVLFGILRDVSTLLYCTVLYLEGCQYTTVLHCSVS